MKTNALKKFSFLMVFSITFWLSACKQQEADLAPSSGRSVAKEPIRIANGRLAFADQSAFTASIQTAIEQKNPLFVYQNAAVRGVIERKGFTSMAGTPVFNNGRVSLEEETDSLDADVADDDLVPDTYFASLLNTDRELQIEDNILRVTAQGTYICQADKYDRLLEILAENPQHGDENGSGNQFMVEDGIFFHDSFDQPLPMEVTEFTVPEIEEPTDPNGRVTFDYLSPSIYNTFETHTFGSHTVVGGWIESALGRREVQYISLGDKERLKLNFFNVNYVVFSSVGISVKGQHKTWIGWNGNLAVQEMRMGWDGIIMSTPIRNVPGPGFPSVSFEKLKLKNLDVDVASYNFLDYAGGSFLTDPQVRQVADLVDGKIQDTFTGLLKKAYDVVYKYVAPQQYNWQKAYTAQFRLVRPDKIRSVLGRHEETEDNADEMTRNFDWTTAIFKFTSNGTSFGLSNFGLGDGAVKFDVEKASIYACAYRNGVWKGVRIIKQ